MNSDFRELLALFNAYRIRYLIVGGVAVGFHAEPRYTGDLDLWIKTDEENARRVHEALARFGAPVSDLTPADFAAEGFFYTMGREPVRVDILMSVAGVEFEACWPRRVEVEVDDLRLVFIGKEDLIAAKLAAGRPQDRRDVRTLRLRAGRPEEIRGRRRPQR